MPTMTSSNRMTAKRAHGSEIAYVYRYASVVLLKVPLQLPFPTSDAHIIFIVCIKQPLQVGSGLAAFRFLFFKQRMC